MSDTYGSVAQIIRADTGVIVARYNYDAYGNVTKQNGIQAPADQLDQDQVNQPYRFQSHYFDKTSGLTDFGFRFYSSGTGRFINQDPLEEDGGINLYGFVNGNPTNEWDEDGLKPGDRYKTRDLAAIAALRQYYPMSNVDNLPVEKTKDREYSGFILRKSVGRGKADYFTYTAAATYKKPTSSPSGFGPLNAVGHYHTHPTVNGYESEFFSREDEAYFSIQSRARKEMKSRDKLGYGTWAGYLGSIQGVRKVDPSAVYPRSTNGGSAGLIQGKLIYSWGCN